MASNPKQIEEEKKPTSSLEVVFIVDITGSMFNQIEGVKKMILKFCEIDRPGVNIHIFTFCENATNCYVSHSPPDLKSLKLVNYVNQIQLSTPPGFYCTNAYGGDSPENVVAAVYSLLERFTDKDNVLAFLITDDIPHHKSLGNSNEAQAEKRWLTNHNQSNHDVFYILNEVIETLNITFVPVLFSTANTNRWYHQAAKLSNGIVLAPQSNDSALLAKGLGSILETLQLLSTTRLIDLVQIRRTSKMCAGFSVLKPLQELNILLKDCETQDLLAIKVKDLNNLEDINASLLGLIETAFDRFLGKKASKRCIGINPQVVSESTRFLVYSILNLLGSNLVDKDKLNLACNNLLKILEKENTHDEKKLVNKFIGQCEIFRQKISENFQNEFKDLHPVKYMITLESAIEYMNGQEQVPTSENDVSNWMEIVLELIMCKLIYVSFPLDINKRPDFADAWSSHIRRIEVSSMLTALSAIKLRDPKTGIYIDPVSKRENNAAVILAHPNDTVLTIIYKCLSVTSQLHGLVQSYLISGGIKIFPSIVPGIQSSVLLKIINDSCVKYLNSDDLEISIGDFSQAEWEFARCLLWSLKQSMVKPAISVYNSIKDGHGLNPVDSISKLFAGLVAFLNKRKIAELKDLLVKLYEELSCDYIQSVVRKSNEKNDDSINELLIDDVKLVDLFVQIENNFDPLTDLHLVEKILKNQVELNKDGFKSLKDVLIKTKGFKYITSVFYTLVNILEADLKSTEFKKSMTPLVSIEELGQIFVVSFVLKKRTSRYYLDEDKEWHRLKNKSEIHTKIKEAILDSILKVYSPIIKLWNENRLTHAKNLLFEQVIEIEGLSIEECSLKISTLEIFVANERYVLKRADTLKALEMISTDKISTLGAAFCLGNWTPEPMSQLKKQSSLILQKFVNHPQLRDDILKALELKQICRRDIPNRHGHHKLNPHPGDMKWTQEYEDERLRAKDSLKIRHTLEKMKSLTLLVQSLHMEKLNAKNDIQFLIYNKLISYVFKIEHEKKIKLILSKIGKIGKKSFSVQNIASMSFKKLYRAICIDH